jgi:hypothetical protein
MTRGFQDYGSRNSNCTYFLTRHSALYCFADNALLELTFLQFSRNGACASFKEDHPAVNVCWMKNI